MPDSPRKSILYVDDDQDDCDLFAEALAMLDSTIELTITNSGQQALNVLFNSKNSPIFPSLVVLDMNMPVMDGKQIVEEMKKDHILSLIPIIMFTTSPHEKHNKYWEEHKIKVITKPSTNSNFLNAVMKIINGE